MRAVSNLHVRELTPLMSPQALLDELPITEAVSTTVAEARETITRIVRREDPRLLVVIGPCSIHDQDAALDYATRLNELRTRFQDRLYILMRTFFEKPRTTTGWRGLLNDPHMDGSFDMAAGLRQSRELLLAINALGLPTATEMLDPISPQYLSDLIALAAIGARTTESQTHRAMASGLSMPVGFKNSTDGNIDVAINAVISARHPHSFLGTSQQGASAVVKTTGNPDGFVILRGSRRNGQSFANYDAPTIAQAEANMRRQDLHPALLIDCSHANSGYDHTRQPQVWETVLHHHLANHDAVVGLMVESFLEDGKQPISADRSALRYGQSITDACIGWETTERLLASAYETLTARQ